jgi:hypothetical protein
MDLLTISRRRRCEHARHRSEKRHWRGEEEADVRARHDGAGSTAQCGTARKQLAAEKQERPFQPSKRIQVDIDSMPKTPEGYQVLWKATTTRK